MWEPFNISFYRWFIQTNFSKFEYNRKDCVAFNVYICVLSAREKWMWVHMNIFSSIKISRWKTSLVKSEEERKKRAHTTQIGWRFIAIVFVYILGCMQFRSISLFWEYEHYMIVLRFGIEPNTVIFYFNEWKYSQPIFWYTNKHTHAHHAHEMWERKKVKCAYPQATMQYNAFELPNKYIEREKERASKTSSASHSQLAS